MPFPRPTFVVALVSSALATAAIGFAQPASEQARLPLALQITSVEGCPAASFQRALETRVRRPFEVQKDAATVMRVSIVSAGAGAAPFEGTATFRGASGQAARSIRGSCAEVTAALALVATTWLEAEPAPEAAVVPGVPATTPAAAAPASASASASAAASAEAAPAPPPDAPKAATPQAAAGSVAPLGADAPVTPTGSTRRPRFAIGAHGLATFGLTDGPAAGAGLAFAFETGRLELRGGVRGALGGDSVAGLDARYLWLTVPLDGCFHLPTGRIFSVAGCGRAEPGLFYATFAASERTLPWLSLGAGLRAGWTIADAVRLEIEGFATVPATGYRITPAAATIAPFRTIAPLMAAGIMVPFW